MERAQISQQMSINPITGAEHRSKTFHSLRHTLPSWLKAAGVDAEIRMKIVGHTSKRIHAGYTHMEMQDLAQALNKAGLGRLVS
jgi:integrase